jgi:hypothetical protein
VPDGPRGLANGPAHARRDARRFAPHLHPRDFDAALEAVEPPRVLENGGVPPRANVRDDACDRPFDPRIPRRRPIEDRRDRRLVRCFDDSYHSVFLDYPITRLPDYPITRLPDFQILR